MPRGVGLVVRVVLGPSPLWLGRLWSLCLHPAAVLALPRPASPCPLFDSLSFLAQHFYLQVQTRGLGRLLAEMPEDGPAPTWLTLSFLSLLWPVPLYPLVGQLMSLLSQAALSAPTRLGALLYAAVAHSHLTGLKQCPPPADRSALEDERLRLHAVLTSLQTAAARLEPLVVFLFGVLGARLLANAFFLLWDERYLRLPELASLVPDILLLGLACYLTGSQLTTIDQITHAYISENIFRLNYKARKQIVHLVKMINDQPLDEYVTITKLFIASFAGFMTTYLITIIQLLPQLKEFAEHYFQLCSGGNSSQYNN